MCMYLIERRPHGEDSRSDMRRIPQSSVQSRVRGTVLPHRRLAYQLLDSKNVMESPSLAIPRPTPPVCNVTSSQCPRTSQAGHERRLLIERATSQADQAVCNAHSRAEQRASRVARARRDGRVRPARQGRSRRYSTALLLPRYIHSKP